MDIIENIENLLLKDATDMIRELETKFTSLLSHHNSLISRLQRHNPNNSQLELQKRVREQQMVAQGTREIQEELETQELEMSKINKRQKLAENSSSRYKDACVSSLLPSEALDNRDAAIKLLSKLKKAKQAFSSVDDDFGLEAGCPVSTTSARTSIGTSSRSLDIGDASAGAGSVSRVGAGAGGSSGYSSVGSAVSVGGGAGGDLRSRLASSTTIPSALAADADSRTNRTNTAITAASPVARSGLSSAAMPAPAPAPRHPLGMVIGGGLRGVIVGGGGAGLGKKPDQKTSLRGLASTFVSSQRR
jgi:hypothetical protein